MVQKILKLLHNSIYVAYFMYKKFGVRKIFLKGCFTRCFLYIHEWKTNICKRTKK